MVPDGTDTVERPSKVVCPYCGTAGIKLIGEYASRYDSLITALYQASGCTNPDCSHYYKSEDATPLPPSTIQRQFSPGISTKLRDISQRLISQVGRFEAPNWNYIGLAVLFVAGLVLLSGLIGPAFFDRGNSGLVGESQATGGGFEVVETVDGWTIYRDGGDYLVVGRFKTGSLFLGPNVTISDTPHIFNSEEAARDAIDAWRTAYDENPNTVPAPIGAPGKTVYPAADIWSIFVQDEQFIVSGVDNGKVLYLHPGGNVSSKPYIFDSKAAAKEAIAAWLRNQSSDSESGANIRPTTESELNSSLANGGDWDPSDSSFNWTGSNGIVVADTGTFNWTLDTNYTLPGFGSNSLDGSGADSGDGDLGGDGSNPDYQDGSGDGDNSDSTNDDSQSDSGPEDDSDSPFDEGSSGDDSLSMPPELKTSNTDNVVQGQVVGPDGEPQEGVTVELHSKVRTATTGENGTYVFTDVPAGVHELMVIPSEDSDLAGPQDVSVRVTSQGNVQMVETVPGVAYFETEGTVAMNRIDLQVVNERPIKVQGVGSRIHQTIPVRQDANMDNVTVTLRGVYTSETDYKRFDGEFNNKTIRIEGNSNTTVEKVHIYAQKTSDKRKVSGKFESGDSLPIKEIVGNDQPADAKIALWGKSEYTQISRTGTSKDKTLDLSIGGTMPPVGPDKDGFPLIEITGDTKFKSKKATGRFTGHGSKSVPIRGNSKTRGATLKITGQERLYRFTNSTNSGQGGTQIYVPGNADPRNEQITVYGQSSTGQQRSASGHGANTITVQGHTSPVDPVIVVKGNTTTNSKKYSGDTRSGGGTADETTRESISGRHDAGGQTKTFDVSGNLSPSNLSMKLTGKWTETYSRERSISKGVHAIGNDDYWNWKETKEKTFEVHQFDSAGKYKLDMWYRAEANDEREADARAYVDVMLCDSGGSNCQTIREWRVDTPMSGENDKKKAGSPSLTFDANSGQEIRVHIYSRVRQEEDWAGDDLDAWANFDAYEVSKIEKPGDVTVTVNGHTHDIGTLNPGETKSITPSSIKLGENSFSISSSDAGDVAYDIAWTERTSTSSGLTFGADGSVSNSVQVALDGKSKIEKATFSRSLADETVTVSKNVGGNAQPEYLKVIATGRVREANTNNIGNTLREQPDYWQSYREWRSSSTTYDLPSGRARIEFNYDMWVKNDDTKLEGKVFVCDSNGNCDRKWMWSGYPGSGETIEDSGQDQITVDVPSGGYVKFKIRGWLATDYSDYDGKFYIDQIHDMQSVRSASVTAEGHTKTIGSLSPGESKTVWVSTAGLTPGSSNNIELQGDGGGVDYQVTVGEKTATKNPRVTDQNGNTICSASGIFTGSKTCDIGQISSGTHQYEVTADGYGLKYEVDLKEKFAVENPRVDIHDDGTSEIDDSVLLSDGEKKVYQLSKIPRGRLDVHAQSQRGPTPKWELKYKPVWGTTDPKFDTNGDGNTDASYNGILLSGESATISAPINSPGATEISGSAGYTGLKYKIEYDSVYLTEDFEADVNGDGSVDVRHSGVISPGQTVSLDVGPLQPGNKQLSASTWGRSGAGWELSYDARYRAENIKVDVVDDNDPEATYPSQLKEGESTTLEVTDMSKGEETIRISSSGGAVHWNLTYTERDVLRTPQFSVDSITVCKQPGIIKSSRTCDVPSKNLDPGKNELNFTVKNGTLKYEIVYVATATPEKATVTVGGKSYQYPNAKTGTGPLNSSAEGAATVNISHLQPGENNISVSAAGVDGIDTKPVVLVEYTNKSYHTKNPSISVVQPDGDTHTKAISAKSLTDEQLLNGKTTTTLPRSWFEEGENKIIVRTTDGSVVNATVRGGATHGYIAGFNNQTARGQDA